jgi:hypothetical protein
MGEEERRRRYFGSAPLKHGMETVWHGTAATCSPRWRLRLLRPEVGERGHGPSGLKGRVGWRTRWAGEGKQIENKIQIWLGL